MYPVCVCVCVCVCVWERERETCVFMCVNCVMVVHACVIVWSFMTTYPNKSTFTSLIIMWPSHKKTYAHTVTSACHFKGYTAYSIHILRTFSMLIDCNWFPRMKILWWHITCLPRNYTEKAWKSKYLNWRKVKPFVLSCYNQKSNINHIHFKEYCAGCWKRNFLFYLDL